jgi:hypothetical protein
MPALAQSSGSPAAAHHGRRGAAEHFADANVTHDGHLTLEQANAGYKSIAKSFSQIDVAHHGYVTLDDIKTWRASKKSARMAAKHAAADAADGIVRPERMGTHLIGARPVQTSTDMIVPTPADLPTAPVDGKGSS